MGKLTINQVEKSDEDVYKCVVLSLSGERLEQTFHLKASGPYIFTSNIYLWLQMIPKILKILHSMLRTGVQLIQLS